MANWFGGLSCGVGISVSLGGCSESWVVFFPLEWTFEVVFVLGCQVFAPIKMYVPWGIVLGSGTVCVEPIGALSWGHVASDFFDDEGTDRQIGMGLDVV